MPYDPNRHHRRSIRLPGYDYTQAGPYFITICTVDRVCLFGEIVERNMRLNPFGQIVAESWQWLATQYNYVELDKWVVMPNHLHGIIVITDVRRGGSRTAPTAPTAPTMKRKPIGRLVGAFKTVSTKRINEHRNTPGAPVWQRNYYEHTICHERDLNTIRRYILENPLRWHLDRENPARTGSDPLAPAIWVMAQRADADHPAGGDL